MKEGLPAMERAELSHSPPRLSIRTRAVSASAAFPRRPSFPHQENSAACSPGLPRQFLTQPFPSASPSKLILLLPHIISLPVGLHIATMTLYSPLDLPIFRHLLLAEDSVSAVFHSNLGLASQALISLIGRGPACCLLATAVFDQLVDSKQTYCIHTEQHWSFHDQTPHLRFPLAPLAALPAHVALMLPLIHAVRVKLLKRLPLIGSWHSGKQVI